VHVKVLPIIVLFSLNFSFFRYIFISKNKNISKKIKLYIYMFGGYWVKFRHTKNLSCIQVCGTECLCKLRSACICVNVYMQDII